MTQEDKLLLLQDLCARLPYKVIIKSVGENKIIGLCDLKDIDNLPLPYLRPMSSMTEEEKREIYNWLVENDVDWFDFNKLSLDKILISFDGSWLLVNWLLKNHFDFNGLIEKGLAIEAPERMYNIKE